MSSGHAMVSLLLMTVGVITLLALGADASDQIEVFAGQDKLDRLGVEVVFNDAKLVRPDPPDPRKAYEFAWDFDASLDLDHDGISDNDNESRTLLTRHTFTEPGNYTVTLTVTDNTGGKAMDTCVVTIVDDELPVAQIVSVSPNHTFAGGNVAFVGSATDADGTVVEYEWSYDVGHNVSRFTSAGGNFSTVMRSSGTFLIRLRVRDNAGFWSETVMATVTVDLNRDPTVLILTTKRRIALGEEIDLIVRYIDPEGDLPSAAYVHYRRNPTDGNEYMASVVQVDQGDNDCTDGKDYHYIVRLNELGNYSYNFEFANPFNGYNWTDPQFIQVTKPKESTPGPGPFSAIMAMLLTMVISRAASPSRCLTSGWFRTWPLHEEARPWSKRGTSHNRTCPREDC